MIYIVKLDWVLEILLPLSQSTLIKFYQKKSMIIFHLMLKEPNLTF